jgi:hypothetical protein
MLRKSGERGWIRTIDPCLKRTLRQPCWSRQEGTGVATLFNVHAGERSSPAIPAAVCASLLFPSMVTVSEAACGDFCGASLGVYMIPVRSFSIASSILARTLSINAWADMLSRPLVAQAKQGAYRWPAISRIRGSRIPADQQHFLGEGFRHNSTRGRGAAPLGPSGEERLRTS